MRRPLLAAAATAGLILTAAAPAMATAPGGSAKPVPFSYDGADFIAELDLHCDPDDYPVLLDLHADGHYVDVDLTEPDGSYKSPAPLVETYSNDHGWITVKNATATGMRRTVHGDVVTLTFYGSGLRNEFSTSDGTMRSLSSAGHFSVHVYTTLDGEFLGVDDERETGKRADDTAVCDAAAAVLS